MARALDIAWLKDICADNESRAWIDKIIAWRDYTLEYNRFVEDTSSFILNLERYALRFNASSSHSTIEVYHEIFKENAHFMVDGFCDKNIAVVLDIGANQGFYTLKLKETCPDCKVIAIEPNPAEYAVLCENLKLNNISNVMHDNVAVAAHAGTLQMEIIPEIGAIGGQNIRIPERPWIKDEFVKILEVPAVTLDSLFTKYNLEKVDILKMDVEGLELEILQSCTRLPQIKRIVTEYHSMQIKDDLIQYLKDHGFSLVFEDPSPSNSYSGDIYFVNQYSPHHI
ncbi:MAG: FkbM family methyltransferase [Geobacteraceae bacterium]|nr:FkbM family methyltransferase [Geobacteraceae bacterium]NTW79389.1 FkbM family methyltransferase [Geobacteraceae bacterium]